MSTIVNRVENSGLVLVDFTEIMRDAQVASLDISNWLFNGVIVKEKEFKDQLENFDTEALKGKYVYVHCSKPAIIPQWVFILLSNRLSGTAKRIIYGSKQELNHLIVQDYVQEQLETYKDERVIVKGCGDEFLPNTYFEVGEKLSKVVKSLMYGEACSAVPIFKRK